MQAGLGDWGHDWAWRVNPSVDEVEVVGYVDSDPAALERISRRLPEASGRVFGALGDAIEATRPDALMVTTTLAGHEPLTRLGLEAGLHVLCEKPFTDNLECARELVDLAAARGLTLMVSQNYRHFPAPRAVASLVDDAVLGNLYEVSIDFRRNDASPPKPLRRHHHDAQPLLIDMSIHHFDLLRMLLRQEPQRLMCQSTNPAWSGFDGPPTANASIAFDDLLVSYRGSWISAGPQTPWAGHWTMEFERGQLWWTSRGENNGAGDDRVVLRPRRGRPRVLSLPELSRIDRAGTLTEFAMALREGREPESSGRDNLRTLAFTLSAVESAKLGAWVNVAEQVGVGVGKL
ncbi:MAG TPA: Gfo/Idh/MocA family oxidoreductase [Candidatus Dormibacteraeota bacterium]|nr:Gfo/Idh/MocA family oxidoreductase [Candidatus Dormibacteraeota bacterium]